MCVEPPAITEAPVNTDTGAARDTGDPVLPPPESDPRWSLDPVQPCESPGPLSFSDQSSVIGDMVPWSGAHWVRYGPAAWVQNSADQWAAVWHQPDGIHWAMVDGSDAGVIEVEFGSRFIPLDVDEDGTLDLLYFGGNVGVVWSFLEPDVEETLFFSTTEGEICGWVEIMIGDFSGDGLPDLLAPTGFECSVPVFPQLAVQSEGRRFDTIIDSPVYTVGATVDSETMDLDGDGDLDVYLCNDFGPINGPNQWLLNDGSGGFTLGETRGSGPTTYCMSVSAADFNQDGELDFLIDGIGSQFALINHPDGFIDYWEAWGLPTLLTSEDMPWGGAATDIDNDGRTDIVMSSSTFSHFTDTDGEPAYLYLQTAPGVFEDSGAAFGFPQGANTRAVAARDVNGDGVLDILMADYRRSPWMYLSEGCTKENWLAIEAPLGTEVRVYTGDEVRAGLVTHHQGFSGFGPTQHHMGLGAHTMVDRVTARVPGVGEVELNSPFTLPRRIRWAPEGR